MNDQNFNLNQFFVLAAFLLIYPSSLFAQAVELKDKQEIEIALTLQSKIRQISAIVESCMRTGEKRLKACQCDAQKYISDLKELYNSALNTHPTWAD